MSAPEANGGWLAPQEPREGLGEYAQVLREHVWLIVACTLAALLASLLYVKLTAPTWQAESHLLATPVNEEPALIGLGLLTNSGNSPGEVSTAASFVTTPEVGARVAARIGAGMTGPAALEHVSAVPVAESNVIAITASAGSAARAQALANAFALETVEQQTQSLHKQLDQILPGVRAELRALPPTERSGAGSLGERLASLEALRAEANPTISVQSLAPLPGAPSSPKKKLSIIAGLLVGLVIGIAVAFARDGLDPRVRREERLRELFRLPVLARVPRERHGLPLGRFSRSSSPLLPGALSPAGQEAYRMLRVALGARGSTSASRSVMVTGSMPSEGKSTVSLNLAATLAQAGMSVVLIETDVRRPSLAEALGTRPAVGIADVLTGEAALADALTPVEGFGGRLQLLAAGSHGHFLPDGLLTATDELVAAAKQLAQHVIFDAPPVTQVSDVLPLTRQVDDVLVVARLGHSRRDQLVNLGEVLTREGVRPAGLVIVDDDFGQTGGYYTEPATRTSESGPAPEVSLSGLGRPLAHAARG